MDRLYLIDWAKKYGINLVSHDLTMEERSGLSIDEEFRKREQKMGKVIVQFVNKTNRQLVSINGRFHLRDQPREYLDFPSEIYTFLEIKGIGYIAFDISGKYIGRPSD